MTRLQAIKHIRDGQRLIKIFRPNECGVSQELEVWLQYQKVCNDFSSRRKPEHYNIGPIHLRFWSASMPHWLHISPRQLLGFIRRNYSRK